MSGARSSPAATHLTAGPELFWTKAKGFGRRGFTVVQLHRRCGDTPVATVRGFIGRMKTCGALKVIGTDRGRTGKAIIRYAVARPTGGAPRPLPRGQAGARGGIQRRLWDTIRGFGRPFLLRELAWIAGGVGLATARSYVHRLIRADLVEVVDAGGSVRGAQGGLPGTYALRPRAHTGPEPLRLVGNRIFDPNLGRFVGLPIDGEEVPA